MGWKSGAPSARVVLTQSYRGRRGISVRVGGLRHDSASPGGPLTRGHQPGLLQFHRDKPLLLSFIAFFFLTDGQGKNIQ